MPDANSERKSTVSVVVPTYYRPKELGDLFDSLLNQSIRPFEVVIVDDTPTKAVRNLCEDFETKFRVIGSRLFYLRNLGTRSTTATRNMGVIKTEGEIILFLDSDVILHPLYIERMLDVFKRLDAIGVQGWIVNLKPVAFPLYQTLKRAFFMMSYRQNGYKFYEYPYPLTGIVSCEAFRGANMAFVRKIFDEFRFDENLKFYAFNEDLLFSYSVFKKYPGKLFITPHAKCMHKVSKEGRDRSLGPELHRAKCRKYVLTKLFGSKGLMMYHWERLGILLREMAVIFLKRIPFISKIGLDLEVD